MAHADWLIDLGPGAGRDGGRIVFEGIPADLVKSGDTLTARHLRDYVRS
jgi:excinuclease UvrABC ATPase subunit